MLEDLIKKAKNRDPNAINSIVHRYKDYVYRIAFMMLKDDSLAKDLSQESFIKVMNKIHLYNQESKFETWLYRLVYNTCLDYIRKHKQHFSELSDISSITYRTSLDYIENDEEKVQIKEYLKKLPEKYRLVLEFFYYQEKSYSEIAEIMNETLSNVKILLYRAKKIFKDILVKERFDAL